MTDDKYGKYKSIVDDALSLWRRSGSLTAEQIDEAVAHLETAGVWSSRSIAKILGISDWEMRKRSTKTDRTGGFIDPAALPLIREELVLAEIGETNPALTAKIEEMGISSLMLSKLTGQPAETIRRRMLKGRDLRGG